MKSGLRALILSMVFLATWGVSAAPLVDINTADSEALVDQLVGIGPHKAMAIIQYRNEHGPFRSVDDLAQVTGIGERTVEQNRERLTVTAPGGQ